MNPVVIGGVSLLQWGLLEECESPEFQGLQDSLCVFPPCCSWELASQMHGNDCKPLAVRRQLLNTDETRDFYDLLGNVNFLFGERSRSRDPHIHHQVRQSNLLYPELKVEVPLALNTTAIFCFKENHRQCYQILLSSHSIAVMARWSVTLCCPAWLS